MPALKGAFLRLDAGLLGFLPDIVIFQFNPESVSRTPTLAQPPPPSDGSGPHNTNDQPGEPSESISFSLRLDACDQLALGNPIAAASGVLPAISALELLLYPKSSLASSLFGGGSQPVQNPPDKLPTVLFFWGVHRIVPVNVTSLSVQETEYDQLLNPIRAEVSVSLDIVTPSQLPTDATFARGAYKYTQARKELMAALNLANPPDILIKTLTSF